MSSAKACDEVRALMPKVTQVDDPRLAVQLIRERIGELNAAGRDIPEELILMQNRLVDECIQASQGR